MSKQTAPVIGLSLVAFWFGAEHQIVGLVFAGLLALCLWAAYHPRKVKA